MDRIEKIKELHDVIKDNPFWTSFDERYFGGLLDLYKKLSWEIYDHESECMRTDPYYVMLSAVTHDFNAMISNLRWKLKEEKPLENMGDIICVLQTFLANAHGLFDKERDETVVGYTYSNGLKKYICLNDGNSNKYIAYNCIKRKSIERLERKLSNDLRLDYVDKKWYNQCLLDIKENKQIIGNKWYIEDYIDMDIALQIYQKTLYHELENVKFEDIPKTIEEILSK